MKRRRGGLEWEGWLIGVLIVVAILPTTTTTTNQPTNIAPLTTIPTTTKNPTNIARLTTIPTTTKQPTNIARLTTIPTTTKEPTNIARFTTIPTTTKQHEPTTIGGKTPTNTHITEDITTTTTTTNQPTNIGGKLPTKQQPTNITEPTNIYETRTIPKTTETVPKYTTIAETTKISTSNSSPTSTETTENKELTETAEILTDNNETSTETTGNKNLNVNTENSAESTEISTESAEILTETAGISTDNTEILTETAEISTKTTTETILSVNRRSAENTEIPIPQVENTTEIVENNTVTEGYITETLNLTVIKTEDLSVNISWNDIEDGDSGEGYTVNITCIQSTHECCRDWICDDNDTMTNDTWINFDGKPGASYNVWVAKDSIHSEIHNFTTNQVPTPPEVTKIIGSTYINLEWSACPYTGPVTYYLSLEEKLKCLEEGEEEWIIVKNRTVKLDGCKYKEKFKDLKPYTEYRYTILAQHCEIECETKEKSGEFTTDPEAPSVPRNLKIIEPSYENEFDKSRNASVEWNRPEKLNGILKKFVLSYGLTGQPETFIEIDVTAEGEDCQNRTIYASVGPLKPKTTYEFFVSAENENPPGKKSIRTSKNITTRFGKPFFKEGTTPLTLFGEDVDAFTQAVKIDTSTFSDANGEIIKYDIEIRKRSKDKEYDFLKVFTSKRKQFQTHFVIGSANKNNPYLESSTEYECRIVIYTNDNGDKRYVAFSKDPVRFRTARSYAVVVGVTLSILFILIAVAIGLVFYRYFYPYVGFTSTRTHSIELPLVVSSPPDVNVERSILLSQLLDTVRRLHSNGQIMLNREYAELKSVTTLDKTKTIASLQNNMSKNRYTNILPYDDTRVILKERRGEPCSDYINASYIHGYSTPREFIACQGPTDECIDDFWRMVWEKRVYVIVMVTQCIEGNKIKCSKYWPDTLYKNGLNMARTGMRVRTMSEKVDETGDFMIRQIQITKGLQTRTIVHYNFITWPDMGCPQKPESLINFVQTVKSAVPDASEHVIVHCSAGVGRTGTFIALGNLMEEMNEKECVDIFHCVYKMRLHRMNMVQTEAQYAFLYQCVLKYYMDTKGGGGPSLCNIPDLLSGTPTNQMGGSKSSLDNRTHTPLYPQDTMEDDMSMDEPFSDEED